MNLDKTIEQNISAYIHLGKDTDIAPKMLVESHKMAIRFHCREIAKATIAAVRIEKEDILNHHQKYTVDCPRCTEIVARNYAVEEFELKSKEFLNEK